MTGSTNPNRELPKPADLAIDHLQELATTNRCLLYLRRRQNQLAIHTDTIHVPYRAMATQNNWNQKRFDGSAASRREPCFPWQISFLYCFTFYCTEFVQITYHEFIPFLSWVKCGYSESEP